MCHITHFSTKLGGGGGVWGERHNFSFSWKGQGPTWHPLPPFSLLHFFINFNSILFVDIITTTVHQHIHTKKNNFFFSKKTSKNNPHTQIEKDILERVIFLDRSFLLTFEKKKKSCCKRGYLYFVSLLLCWFFWSASRL